ncbi:MAG: hypothetical protein ACI9G1_003276 [Pirellulaceae bacterium]|jgi:hypothetical protein
MNEIGSFRTRTCGGLNRRAFVQTAASVPLALGLSAGANGAVGGAAKAKSVIVVWLWGGPSQLDTFDPKPKAPSEYRGPFAAISTDTPGVQFAEPLPRLAQRSNQFAVVRSTVLSGNHGLGPLTGEAIAMGQPNFGSVLARHRGNDRQLPSFISIVPPKGPGHGAFLLTQKGRGGGDWGSAYDPFMASCSAEGETALRGFKLIDGLSLDRLDDRRLLRAQLDKLKRNADGVYDQWDHQFKSAYRLLTNPESAKAFDVSLEPAKVRESYGYTSFGQSLLLGRRLVEAGTPYVQVNWSLGVDSVDEGTNTGWDTHYNAFGLMVDYHGPILDWALSALLDDLRERGLLDQTLVVAMGEMGRTPKINDNGGRDHWATCSSLWAGAGVKGGRIVGATDAIGGHPISKPIDSSMVGATILDRAGVDSATRAQLRLLPGAEVIHDLF